MCTMDEIFLLRRRSFRMDARSIYSGPCCTACVQNVQNGCENCNTLYSTTLQRLGVFMKTVKRYTQNVSNIPGIGKISCCHLLIKNLTRPSGTELEMLLNPENSCAQVVSKISGMLDSLCRLSAQAVSRLSKMTKLYFIKIFLNRLPETRTEQYCISGVRIVQNGKWRQTITNWNNFIYQKTDQVLTLQLDGVKLYIKEQVETTKNIWADRYYDRISTN